MCRLHPRAAILLLYTTTVNWRGAPSRTRSNFDYFIASARRQCHTAYYRKTWGRPQNRKYNPLLSEKIWVTNTCNVYRKFRALWTCGFWDMQADLRTETRHRASTSVYSLTFRVRVATPRSMDEIERRTQQARRFYCRRGQSSPTWVVRAVGLVDYRWVLPRISIVLP